jgi:hypothetical protein
MRNKIAVIILLFVGWACTIDHQDESTASDRVSETDIKFDQTKWSTKEGRDYPYREQMLNDIIHNDSVRGLYKDEILALLGEPDRSNEGYLYYRIKQKRLGPWPLHTKTLVIKCSADHTIEWIKIHE